jgi:hypothetical protein
MPLILKQSLYGRGCVGIFLTTAGDQPMTGSHVYITPQLRIHRKMCPCAQFWRHLLANMFCALLLLSTNSNTCAALADQAPQGLNIAADAQRVMTRVLPWMHSPLAGGAKLSGGSQCALLLGSFQLVAVTVALWVVGMLNASAARHSERRARAARGGAPLLYDLGDGGMAVQAALLLPLGQCLMRGIDLYATILSWVGSWGAS